ncbi:hypothetical protein SO802_006458 [Lithocarpus litseifolius]|uniref:Uncharacterized protein n=1 Tax=Lithocarpus litseifolius TaxID=425828 RepID=A0AAW2DQ60_9ROSI
MMGGIDGGGSIDSGGDGIGLNNNSGNDVESNGGLFGIIMAVEICTMIASSTIFSFGALVRHECIVIISPCSTIMSSGATMDFFSVEHVTSKIDWLICNQ